MRNDKNWWIPAMLALVLAGGGCSPEETFVLMSEGGGKGAGTISVTGFGSSQIVSQPLDAVQVDDSGAPPRAPVRYTSREVARDFSAALDRQPLPAAARAFYFEAGTTSLTDESRDLLGDVLLLIADRRFPDVSVIGHADRTGDEARNLVLSLERAEAVRDLLVASGVDADIISVDSHGEGNPLVPTPDNVAEPRNRRVEVTVR